MTETVPMRRVFGAAALAMVALIAMHPPTGGARLADENSLASALVHGGAIATLVVVTAALISRFHRPGRLGFWDAFPAVSLALGSAAGVAAACTDGFLRPAIAHRLIARHADAGVTDLALDAAILAMTGLFLVGWGFAMLVWSASPGRSSGPGGRILGMLAGAGNVAFGLFLGGNGHLLMMAASLQALWLLALAMAGGARPGGHALGA